MQNCRVKVRQSLPLFRKFSLHKTIRLHCGNAFLCLHRNVIFWGADLTMARRYDETPKSDVLVF